NVPEGQEVQANVALGAPGGGSSRLDGTDDGLLREPHPLLPPSGAAGEEEEERTLRREGRRPGFEVLHRKRGAPLRDDGGDGGGAKPSGEGVLSKPLGSQQRAQPLAAELRSYRG